MGHPLSARACPRIAAYDTPIQFIVGVSSHAHSRVWRFRGAVGDLRVLALFARAHASVTSASYRPPPAAQAPSRGQCLHILLYKAKSAAWALISNRSADELGTGIEVSLASPTEAHHDAQF